MKKLWLLLPLLFAAFACANTVVTTCGDLSTADEYYELGNGIVSSGSCLNITAPNIYLDCKGNEVNFGAGALDNDHFGIRVNANNVTLANCLVGEAVQVGMTAMTNQPSILVQDSADLQVFNVTTFNQGYDDSVSPDLSEKLSEGIRIENTHRVWIDNYTCMQYSISPCMNLTANTQGYAGDLNAAVTVSNSQFYEHNSDSNVKLLNSQNVTFVNTNIATGAGTYGKVGAGLEVNSCDYCTPPAIQFAPVYLINTTLTTLFVSIGQIGILTDQGWIVGDNASIYFSDGMGYSLNAYGIFAHGHTSMIYGVSIRADAYVGTRFIYIYQDLSNSFATANYFYNMTIDANGTSDLSSAIAIDGHSNEAYGNRFRNIVIKNRANNWHDIYDSCWSFPNAYTHDNLFYNVTLNETELTSAGNWLCSMPESTTLIYDVAQTRDVLSNGTDWAFYNNVLVSSRGYYTYTYPTSILGYSTWTDLEALQLNGDSTSVPPDYHYPYTGWASIASPTSNWNFQENVRPNTSFYTLNVTIPVGVIFTWINNPPSTTSDSDCYFFASLFDVNPTDAAWLEFDNGDGTFTNSTPVYNPTTTFYIVEHLNTTVHSVIRWRWWANDTAGYVNVTAMRSFLTSPANPLNTPPIIGLNAWPEYELSGYAPWQGEHLFKSDVIGNDSYQYLGEFIAVGDVNNDSIPDLVIGDPSADNSFGRVYVYLSAALAPDVSFVEDNYSTRFDGVEYYANLGQSVAIGDVNNDSIPDLVIGAIENSGVNGVTYVIYGGSSFPTGHVGIDNVYNRKYVGEDYGVSSAVATGDVNNDSISDLAIGGGDQVFIIYGNSSITDGVYSLNEYGNATFNRRYTNNGGGARIGTKLAIGFFGSENLSSLVIGDRDFAYGYGEAFVIKGNSSVQDTGWTGVDLQSGGYNVRYYNPNYGFYVGNALAIGQVSYQGYGDLVLGQANGEFYVISNIPSDGDYDLTQGGNRYQHFYSSAGADWNAPYAFAIGDLNRDGFNDLAVSGLWTWNNHYSQTYQRSNVMIINGGTKGAGDYDLAYVQASSRVYYSWNNGLPTVFGVSLAYIGNPIDYSGKLFVGDDSSIVDINNVYYYWNGNLYVFEQDMNAPVYSTNWLSMQNNIAGSANTLNTNWFVPNGLNHFVRELDSGSGEFVNTTFDYSFMYPSEAIWQGYGVGFMNNNTNNTQMRVRMWACDWMNACNVTPTVSFKIQVNYEFNQCPNGDFLTNRWGTYKFYAADFNHVYANSTCITGMVQNQSVIFDNNNTAWQEGAGWYHYLINSTQAGHYYLNWNCYDENNTLQVVGSGTFNVVDACTVAANASICIASAGGIVFKPESGDSGMLNFIIAFGAIAAFFLIMFWWLNKENKEKKQKQEELGSISEGSYLDSFNIFNRYFSLGLAVFSLLMMFAFAWTAYPTLNSSTTNFTYMNQTVNGVDVPIVSSAAVFSNSAMPEGATRMAELAFNAFTYIGGAFLLLFVITRILGFVHQLEEQRKRHQQGDYDDK